VGRRVLPALLVGIAVIADSAGAHGLARNALLFALPFASVAALVGFGGFLDSRERFSGIQALCSGAIVALLVLSCAVRSNAVHGVPPLAVSSLLAVTGLFALKGALSVVPHWRRLDRLSPAKP
jgi:hypothetical protein